MKRQKADGLDRQLSYRLKKALGDDGRADWLDVRERAGMSRTLWRWSQRRVLLVAGVLVLAVGAAGASTGIIPWLDRKPAAVPAPAVTPPCKAENLYAKLIWDLSFENSEFYGAFALVNTGSRACSLEQRVRLELINPSVSKSHLFVRYAPPPQQGVGGIDTRSLLRSVPPDTEVVASFSWKNWCGPGPSPTAFELQLANGARFSVPLPAAPSCLRKRSQTALRYWGLQVDGAMPAASPLYRIKIPSSLGASIVATGMPTVRRTSPSAFGGQVNTYLRVQRGAVLRYRVALRNTSERLFRFTRCPLYMEHLQNVSSEFILNCRPAGDIAPGKSAVFAMELYVPDDASLGAQLLQWSILGRRFPPHAEQLVWIVP